MTDAGSDSREWNLTEAVHALVDDTWWDHRDPGEEVGTILASDAEAEVIRPLVAAVCKVSDDARPESPDVDWFDHPDWPHVQALASEALAVFAG